MADPHRARPPGFTLEQAAARVGHYRWVEMKLFETLGGWVTTVPELDVKVLLGTQAHHHAFHAELWQGCLPALREMDPDLLTAPAAGMDAFMAALSAPRRRDETVEKLVGVYRVVVPRLIAAYSHHLAHASDIADGPTIRTLGIVLRDELEDWRDGEASIQSLVGSGEEIERAAAQQVRLEKLMLAAGGVAGPESPGVAGSEG